ncbi:MAG: sigma-70 family RNA polymerase sigma factor [Acidobacteriota bacterium]
MADGVSARPTEVVEHLFRRESAKLVAVLTRAFGLRHLDLVEDKVQEAMVAAMQTWPRRGIPANPAGWIHRVARNRVFDALRRDAVHRRVVAEVAPNRDGVTTQVDEWLTDEQVPDSLLRMIFVCCHPHLERGAQLALTLKLLCGFSAAEVARGLLISTEAAKKRVQRAKAALALHQPRLDLPASGELGDRLAAVHTVLYLLFNEGYSTSSGHLPLRDDMCEEAARLCHLLCEDETFSTPESRALLALMLAHSARLAARLDSEGAIVLLAEQDRSRWDRRLMGFAEVWLHRSQTERPSRFHFEAAISMVHNRAPSVAETDWALIVRYYDRLVALHPSPLYRLNRAIARGEAGEVAGALEEVKELGDHRDLRGYHWVHCALGRLYECLGDPAAAVQSYEAARAAGSAAPHEKVLLGKRLARLRAR